MAAMIGTRNDEDLTKMLDARSDYGLSLRRDYFRPKSEIDSPTGNATFLFSSNFFPYAFSMASEVSSVWSI